MSVQRKTKSPLGLRLAILTGSVALSLLLIWIMGYLLKDIGNFRTVTSQEILDRHVGVELRESMESQSLIIDRIKQNLGENADRQQYLHESIDTFSRTLDQMIRLSQAVGAVETPAEKDSDVVAISQRQFLAFQGDLQSAKDKELTLTSQLRTEENTLRDLRKVFEEREREARKEWQAIDRRQSFWAAAAKLAFLFPWMAFACWLYLSKRSSLWAPMVYAVDVAVVWRVVWVIHEYFQPDVFRYLLLIVAILICVFILIHLIRSAAQPALAILIRRYREAYRKGQCPTCGFPILMGGEGERAMAIRRLAGKRVTIQIDGDAMEARPYACPSCGEGLFHKCRKCGQTRHTLLPTCRHCGDREMPFDGERPADETVTPS